MKQLRDRRPDSGAPYLRGAFVSLATRYRLWRVLDRNRFVAAEEIRLPATALNVTDEGARLAKARGPRDHARNRLSARLLEE